jgi:hypothetical protein
VVEPRIGWLLLMAGFVLAASGAAFRRPGHNDELRARTPRRQRQARRVAHAIP